MTEQRKNIQCRSLMLATSSQIWDKHHACAFGAGREAADWVGSSKRDFLAFPRLVQRELGNVLGLAQFGGKHPKSKPWKGEGSGVFEAFDDYDGNTYRAIYTVRFRDVIYVLHALQKKSPRGVRTARTDYRIDRAASQSRAAGS